MYTAIQVLASSFLYFVLVEYWANRLYHQHQTSDRQQPLCLLQGQIEKKKASYSQGCDDYLVKPFEPSELLLRIKKLL